jgi:exodeoxyribonuclease V alpha subunit
VAVTALTEIYRQKRDSLIVHAAHAVLRGEVPEGGGEGSDFFIVDSRSPSHTRQLVRELVVRRIPRAFGFDAVADVQVLCPMYRGEAGAHNLNRDLQDLLNPAQPEIERGGLRYRVGDKVLQVRNDYDADVFNGDVGRIESIDKAQGHLAVRFGDRSVVYRWADLDQVVPGYAISVHRAQGSEYPAVVVPLAMDHFVMLRRNLVYTAITRGRRLVVLVGARRALATAVASAQEARRNSELAGRLRAAAAP